MKPTLNFLRNLVGNPDAFALQRPDGAWTPVRRPLDDAQLGRHLARECTVGTYVNKGDQARTLVFDVDSGDLDEAKAIVHELAAVVNVPMPFIGVEDSGRKGYHVWVVLSGYVPAEQLRRLGRMVLALAGIECEVFPKQDEARDLGNLVKLPGGIHQVTGKANDFIGVVPRPLPVKLWNERVVPQLPEQFRGRAAGGGATRFPCMEHLALEGAGEGWRNVGLFQYATLARRAGLVGDPLEAAVYACNAGFDPPLDPGEVEAVLSTSATSGPICDQLPKDVQCGELCIRERTSGLSTRPGQLKHASEGESVVVTLGSRVGKNVQLLHDDLVSAKGVLSGS